jgi:hypothetical protein
MGAASIVLPDIFRAMGALLGALPPSPTSASAQQRAVDAATAVGGGDEGAFRAALGDVASAALGALPPSVFGGPTLSALLPVSDIVVVAAVAGGSTTAVAGGSTTDATASAPAASATLRIALTAAQRTLAEKLARYVAFAASDGRVAVLPVSAPVGPGVALQGGRGGAGGGGGGGGARRAAAYPAPLTCAALSDGVWLACGGDAPAAAGDDFACTCPLSAPAALAAPLTVAPSDAGYATASASLAAGGAGAVVDANAAFALGGNAAPLGWWATPAGMGGLAGAGALAALALGAFAHQRLRAAKTAAALTRAPQVHP